MSYDKTKVRTPLTYDKETRAIKDAKGFVMVEDNEMTCSDFDQHVVHCVNHHDALVRSLEWLINLRCGNSKGGDEFNPPSEAEWDLAWDGAKLAFAEAKGDSK